MREQPMAAGDVQHAASPADSPHASSHFPGFVQFLPRETTDTAQHPADPVEQRVARESAEIMCRQPAVRSCREIHRPILPATEERNDRVAPTCRLNRFLECVTGFGCHAIQLQGKDLPARMARC